MDISTSHWGAIPRTYPSPFRIQTIGYVPCKTEWMRRSFSSCNFSFILSGRGQFHHAGQVHEVTAPFVLTQWPGDHLEYGPADGTDSWEELYFIYQAEAYDALRQCGFLARPCWPISHDSTWRATLKSLTRLLREPREIAVDHLDRCCERLILESLTELPSASTHASPLLRLRRDIEADPAQWPDFAQCAQRAGMSETTFRRAWVRETGHPPARYLAELKIKEACRLLVETRLTVGEIGLALGYEDPLYFSRKFHALAGCTATEYRRTYQPRET